MVYDDDQIADELSVKSACSSPNRHDFSKWVACKLVFDGKGRCPNRGL